MAYWETAEERNPSWFTTTWSENPTAIVPGDRVIHLVYDVSRRGRKASVVPADGDPPLDPW
jgi:hypothetical protein